MKRALILTLALIFTLTLTSCGVDTADLGASVNDAVAEDEITNLGIIQDENHPRYFDDIDTVETAWEDYIGEQVEVNDVASDIIPVVKIETNADTERVNLLAINVAYIEDEEYCEFDDALELAKEYTDMDVLQDNYELVESKGLEDDDSYKSYLVHYVRTPLGDDSLDDDFYMRVETDDEDEVMTISMSSEDEAAFAGEEFEWEYMLLDEETVDRSVAETETTTVPATTTEALHKRTWVLNTNSYTFHDDDSCSAVKRMNSSNKQYVEETYDYMESHYEPCKICKPWLSR